ncbi:MAG: hypothetical protein ACR2FO_01960 [Actinomycetota bacterium]
MAASFAGWLYSWYIIRGVRRVYSVRDAGGMPTWLLVLMALTSTALIATTVCSGMRLSVWPAISMGAGVALLALIVGSQLAVMSSFFGYSVSIGRAFSESIQTRSPVYVAIFIAGLPALMVMSGLRGLLDSRAG